MKKKLTKVAAIFSGQTFRKKVQNDPDGTVWVIQMKDLNDEYTGLKDLPHAVQESEISKNQILKKGDILFLAKGRNNPAIIYNYDQPAVAVSLFFVIRPNDLVQPEYLSWYLNRAQSQGYFNSMKEGALVGNIKKSVLENLEIELPSTEVQQNVANLYGLSQREEKISNELVEIRKDYIDNLLNTCIQ